MQGAGHFSRAGATPAKVKIAERGFSRRQTALLEGVFDLFSDEFRRSLGQMLDELEQQLFRNAEQARSNEAQRALLEAQRSIRERRDQVAPGFVTRVETALATLADPPPPKVENASRPQFSELSLVDTGAMDETVTLKEIGARTEIRNSLPLFLLGQRMGVVARRPAFDAEHLPVGPHRLCQILRETIEELGLDAEQRGLVYRQFDRGVMQFLGPFYEALNAYLIGEGVLPHLTYVPPRSMAAQRRGQASPSRSPAKPAAGNDGKNDAPQAAPEMRGMPARADGAPFTHEGSTAAPASRPMPGMPPQTGAPQHAASPHQGGAAHRSAPSRAGAPAGRDATSPPGTAAAGATSPSTATPRPPGLAGHDALPWSRLGNEAEAGGQDAELFDTLRRLLAGRRSLLDKLKAGGARSTGRAATPEQVHNSLDRIQQRYSAQLAEGSAPPFQEIRRELLQQLRQEAADGVAPQLSGEQGDTVDLVGMLFEHIAQEVRPHTPGGSLLAQLQLPLLRVALQDQGFFTERAHPARQLLEAVAETSACWSSEDEIDRDLIQKMGVLVRRVNEEQSSDPALFSHLMTDLTGHLTTQQRKAEVTERRHVEAARGREKLEIARLKAEEAIEATLAGKQAPRFLHTLLEQVWTDVLALDLLRGGDEAPAFLEHLNVARRLVEAASPGGGKAIDAAEAAQMRSRIEAALSQVGHAGEDASDICSRLLSAVVAGGSEVDAAATAAAADPASRTELTMKLRTRARLGQDVQGARADGARKKEKPSALSPEEQAWHDRLKRLPFGTWFDFTINQQGDRVRRRMSWFSTVTDHCLFVNHRGQRAGDYTLVWLAREMSRGNVRLVEPDHGSIVDRAWKAIVATLRSFTGSADTKAVPAT